MRVFWDAIVHVVFPPLCLQCREDLLHPRQRFCEHCMQSFQYIDLSERCPSCFSIDCRCCSMQGLNRIIAAFEYQGPAATLMKEFKYGSRPSLAKDFAAFMVVQLVRAGFPMPDVLIPVPQSFIRYLQRGYNQSACLAKQLGRFFNRPVYEGLKRRSGGFSQSSLDEKQRKNLPLDTFRCKKNLNLSDQIVFLVDDVITTGTTLSHCAQALQPACPKAVYGIAACIA